jgi:2-methylcitrate dehydratase PrpD
MSAGAAQAATRVPPRHARPSLASTLATFVADTPGRQVPAAVRTAVKLFTLDTLAVAWAGSGAPGCRDVHALLDQEGGRPDATAWAYGGRLPAAAAGFVNATAAAALDYDTLGRDVPVHVNIAVVPAALAMAERENASGDETLAALVLASEIEYRLAVSSTLPHRGWSYTGIHGVFGAAAAAARLLRLDALRTRHALGLAYIQACGNQQANVEPSLGKRLLSSFAVRNGIQAAQLAAAGITAPELVLEGEFGLYRLYQPGDPQRLIEDLGTRFDCVDQSLKKYPSCGCNHTSIEAVLQLRARHALRPEEVARARVRISPYIDRIVGMPYDPSRDPQVAAQFSLRYSVACALVRGRLGLTEIEAEAARDPLINALLARVDVVVEPDWTGDRGPIELTIETRRGVFATRVEHVPGSREAPLGDEAIRAKHDECFRRGVRPLRAEAVERLRHRVSALEKLESTRTLFNDLD